MRQLFLAFTLTLFIVNCFSQTKPERTLTHNIYSDTTLKPDYFNVEIVVAESYKLEKDGRKFKTIFISLDTAIENLMAELQRLGFNQKLKKSSIAEKNFKERNYYNGKILFQVGFDFVVSDKDSVEQLFSKINKDLVLKFIVTPKFNNSTLDNAKDNLIKIGLEKIKKYITKIAEENKLSLIKQSNIGFGFNKKNNAYSPSYNAYGEEKNFIVDLNDVEYTLNTYYTYIFEDK